MPLLRWMLVLLCLLPLGVRGETLTWGVLPLPGVFNVRDGELVDGVLYEAMQLLDAQLAELHIRYEVLPFARLEQRLLAGEPLCISGQLQSAERDRLGHFVAFLQSPPIHVLVRRQTYAQLALDEGRVSLAWLLANPYLRGALTRGRVYPPAIREPLQQALDARRLLELAAGTAGDNLLLMVSHRRIDYAFEYPMVYTEVARSFSLGDSLVSVPLLEGDALVPVGFYCPRTAWGERMAARLERAVVALLAQPQGLLQVQRRWLPEEVYARFSADFRRYYRQRAAGR